MQILFTKKLFFSLLVSTFFFSGCTPALIDSKNRFQAGILDISQKIKALSSKSGANEKCADGEGIHFALKDSKINPEKVGRNEEVTVVIVYSVSCSPEPGILIREKNTLWHDGKLLTILTEENKNRGDGTWESSLTFKTPKSAQAGKYEIQQAIFNENDAVLKATVFFTLTK